MNLNESRQLVRDARRTSRKMGGTFYTEVIDPNTGERTIQPRWHHGIPASFGGGTTENTIATLVGALSTISLYKAAELNTRAKIGSRDGNAKQQRQAYILGLASVFGYASLLPWSLPSPFHGSRAPGRPTFAPLNGVE